MGNLLKPSQEMSYILGVQYGDGDVHAGSTSGNYAIRLTVKDLDFLDEWRKQIASLLKKIVPPIHKVKGKEIYSSVAYSKELCYFLLKNLDFHKKYIEEHPLDFLRGFFDSEGCVRHMFHKGLKISANNTNLILIQYIKELLKKQGIDATGPYITKSNRISFFNGRKIQTKLPIYEISFTRHSDIKKFDDLIGFSINRKKERLIKYLSKFIKICTFCNKQFNARTQHAEHCPTCACLLTKDEPGLFKLKEEYLKEGKVLPHMKQKNQHLLISRITCDIDDPSRLDESVQIIKKFGFTKDLEIKTSSSGIGKHLVAWTNDGGYPLTHLLFIRHLAGDDTIRIMLDAKSNRMINVLFTSKKKNKTNLILDGIPLEVEVMGSEENTKISFGEI